MEQEGKPNFLLVVDNPAARDHYLNKLKNVGATCKTIEGPEDIYSVQQQDLFHGLMIDVHTLLRFSSPKRAVIKDYSSALPTIKHFFHPETNNLIVNFSSLDDSTIDNIEDFVRTCARQPGRRLRREPRYNIFLNVVLNGHLTHIANISRRGSYILTTDGSLGTGDEVSITIDELRDKTPVKCMIRRKVEWGSKYQVAGIGVEFVSMTDSQRSELDTVLQGHIERMENILDKWDEFRDDPSQHIVFMQS
jgi:Tfp pilus assembly protein PilZ